MSFLTVPRIKLRDGLLEAIEIVGGGTTIIIKLNYL